MKLIAPDSFKLSTFNISVAETYQTYTHLDTHECVSNTVATYISYTLIWPDGDIELQPHLPPEAPFTNMD